MVWVRNPNPNYGRKVERPEKTFLQAALALEVSRRFPPVTALCLIGRQNGLCTILIDFRLSGLVFSRSAAEMTHRLILVQRIGRKLKRIRRWNRNRPVCENECCRRNPLNNAECGALFCLIPCSTPGGMSTQTAGINPQLAVIAPAPLDSSLAPNQKNRKSSIGNTMGGDSRRPPICWSKTKKSNFGAAGRP